MDNIEDLFEYFLEKEDRTILDIFPCTVGVENTMYGDVEEYLLENEFKDFTKKVFLTFIKFICYYEYDSLIVETRYNSNFEYTKYNKCELSIIQIRDILCCKLHENKIFKCSFYFKELDILFSIDTDAYDILEKIASSHGLFTNYRKESLL